MVQGGQAAFQAGSRIWQQHPCGTGSKCMKDARLGWEWSCGVELQFQRDVGTCKYVARLEPLYRGFARS